MIIEINMGVEILPVEIFMRAAADVLRIVEQIGNVRDTPHQREEFAIPHRADRSACKLHRAGEDRG